MTLISIAICTRNRAEHLAQTLAAMKVLVCPTGAQTELLVIDNGSTDGTADLVKQSRIDGIHIRHVYEATPGLSNARNRALYEAKGDCLLFTDDDVRVGVNWIEDMSRPLLENRADITAGGVTLAPHLRRSWMGASHLGYLASTEHTCTEAHPWPVGANMALSRRVMEKIPFFDPELGAGTAYGVGEETLYHAMAVKAAMRTAFEWQVVAEHHFEANRLTRSSFMGFAGKVGRSLAYRQYHWEHCSTEGLEMSLKIARKHLMLKRIKYAAQLIAKEGIPLWELALLTEIARLEQLQLESNRPHNYAQFALKKTQGILPERGAQASPIGSGVE